jgi:hypothetical protein
MLDTTIGGEFSDSYNSLVELNTYAQDYGAPDSFHTASDLSKEIGLRTATQFIDAVYGKYFVGYRVDSTQALQWPRQDVYDTDGYYIANDIIPKEAKDVCNLLAIEVIDGNDLYQLDSTESYPIKSLKQKVGTLEEATTYAVADSNSTRQTSQKDNGKYWNMLSRYLGSTTSVGRG